MDATRRYVLAGAVALAAFALAGLLFSVAVGGPTPPASHRLPFADTDPALAAAGLLVLFGVGAVLREALRR